MGPTFFIVVDANVEESLTRITRKSTSPALMWANVILRESKPFN